MNISYIHGIDISSWQRGLNVASLKEQGVDFAILKVGEGKTFADPCFDEFYNQAVSAGIAVGAYFYSHATTVDDAISDAKRALMLVKGLSLPLGIYMDVEEPSQMKLRDSELTAVVKAFCDTIRDGGYKSGAYGSLGNLWAKVGPSYLGSDVIVWIAAWSNSAPKFGDIWQNTDSAHFSGYSGNIDGDQALSTRFIAMVNGSSDEPTPQPAPEPTPEPSPEPSDGTFAISGIPVIKYGDTGDKVKALQGELIANGYPCGGKRDWRGAEKPDGIFGNVTQESVRSFQRSKRIKDTGIADKETRKALLGV